VQVPLHLKRWREVRRAPSVWRAGRRRGPPIRAV
jgi:hypothetical protein